jgi:AraC family transcriptional regulator
MHAWEAIENTLNIIEENLSEELTIETLANAVGLSPFYFQRLFGRLVKKPVNEYIKLRRLAQASKTLIDSEKRIMDIAYEYGFSSHASFTRAFTEAYGITPEELRHSAITLNHFVKPDLSLSYSEIDENVPIITDGITVEVTRRNLGDPRCYTGILHEIPVTELSDGQTTGVALAAEMWQNFQLQKAVIPKLLPNGNECGVLFMETAREGFCNYLTGAESERNTLVDGYSTFTLPCGEYIICNVEAENFSELVGSAIHKAASFVHGWMERHQLVCGDFAAKMYLGNDPDANYMEIWLPVRPMSHLNRQEYKNQWDKNNGNRKPFLETIDSYVNSYLWEQLREHLELAYQSYPVLEFSKCSAQHGWNVKYKKSGRSLCTLYPEVNHFFTLIVIGQHEQEEFERNLPFFSSYIQNLYHETKSGIGQKWLMIDVREDVVLEDVKRCIAIRRGKRKTDNRSKENDSNI